MQQEAEPKPRETVWEIPIRDHTMRITVDDEALHEATKGLRHGPCSVSFDSDQFRSLEREPSLIDHFSLLDRIRTKLDQVGLHLKYLFPFSSFGIIHGEVGGPTTICFNPEEIIARYIRRGFDTDKIFTIIRTKILESFNHEITHANQDNASIRNPVIRWTDPALRPLHRIELGLIDIFGYTIIIAQIVYFVSEIKKTSSFEKVYIILVPIVTTSITSSIRELLYKKFVHSDRPSEIEATIAASCPFASDIFKFELK